jgi:hypothetical protein
MIVTLSAPDWAVIDYHLYFASTNEVSGFTGDWRHANRILAKLYDKWGEMGMVDGILCVSAPASITIELDKGDVALVLELLRATTMGGFDGLKDEERAKVPQVVSALSALRKG